MLGLRGFIAVALTPVLSVSIIAVSAVVAPVLGMEWGWWVPALGTAVVVACVLTVAGLRRLFQPPRAPEEHDGGQAGREPAALVWGLTGAVIAAVLISVRMLLAAPALESITQNYDTVFHLSAVHYALETGNASSWYIGEFTRPGAESRSPYPGAWHALVALLVQLSGLSIAVATNVMWLAIAALVWSVNALLLTRTLVGPNPAVLAAAGVLTSAFAAFPYLLLQYGSVYPNTLSYAMVPSGLALVLILVRAARVTVVSRPMAALLLVLYLPAQALSQPNGLVSIAFLLTPLLLLFSLSWLRSGFAVSVPTGVRRTGLVLGIVGSVVLVLLTNSTFSSLFSWAHPKSMPFLESLWRAAMHFPAPTWLPAVVLTALVLSGLYCFSRHHHRGWMMGSFVLIVLVYGLAIGSDNGGGNLLIAPWYGNPERLAALMPLLAVPWAAVGLEQLLAAAKRRSSPALSLPFAALVAATLLAIASPTLWQMNIRLAEVFEVPAASDEDKQLDVDQRALLQQLGEHLPEDTVLANNPWNGSSLAAALAGQDVLFPYMTMGAVDEDRALLRDELDGITTSVQVCAAAERLSVTYLLDFGDNLIGAAEEGGGSLYQGIDRATASGTFEEVASVGEARLLKLPACNTTGG